MNPNSGILFKVASTFVFTVMLACIKALPPAVPTGEVVFSRSFFALAPILFFAMWRGRLADAVTTRRLGGHVWRSLLGAGAMAFSFAALRLLPLPEALAIGYAAPFITLILAAVFLGETIRIYRTSAVIVGMVGILIILWPRLSVLGSGALGSAEVIGSACALVAAVLLSGAMVAVRRLVSTENTLAIVFYFSFVSAILSLATLPFGWVWPDPLDAGLLVLSGILGGIGQILMTESYRHAETSTIAPFEYTSMIWGLAIGYLLFAEVPTVAVLCGALIVVASGIFIILREHALGLERARARKVTTPHG